MYKQNENIHKDIENLKINQKKSRTEKYSNWNKKFGKGKTTHALWSQKKVREKGGERIFDEILAENFPNWWRHEFKHTWRSTYSKSDKPQETNIRTHCGQTFKRLNLDNRKREVIHYT